MNTRNISLLGLLTLASALLLGAAEPPAEPLSTERHVHGVITAVDPAVVTITSSQRTIAGKIDPVRTKVTLHGKPAKLADLQVTAHAKAELCLDDVWVAIDAH
jgi:hypothetical protein